MVIPAKKNLKALDIRSGDTTYNCQKFQNKITEMLEAMIIN